MQLLSTPVGLAERFNVEISDAGLFHPQETISAFDHSHHPIITTENPHIADCRYRWGLIPPDWNKPAESIWNHTISAKLEYISRRYAWKKVSQNRCLVPVTAYFEYHWNDPKGKSKTRFTVHSEENHLFALAGMYSRWQSGTDIFDTFAVCTTVANEIMKHVHNKDAAKNYHRMPVMLNIADEREWLKADNDYMDFAYPNYRPKLAAIPDAEPQGRLF